MTNHNPTAVSLDKLNVCIIGLGQIGTSIGWGLKGKVKSVVGFDTNDENIQYCLQNGIVDGYCSIESISQTANLVIIATPVDSIGLIIRKLLNAQKGGLIITDVGSTKREILQMVKGQPHRSNYVASHPMAGNTGSGPKSASEYLFVNKNVFICDSHNSSDYALALVCSLWQKLGAKISYIDSAKHDEIVSAVSHIPQLLSYLLANMLAAKGFDDEEWSNAASSGFNSMTRLAQSKSKMWIPIFYQNKGNILRDIRMLMHELAHLEEAISKHNSEVLADFISKANTVREKFDNKQIKMPETYETHE